MHLLGFRIRLDFLSVVGSLNYVVDIEVSQVWKKTSLELYYMVIMLIISIKLWERNSFSGFHQVFFYLDCAF